MDALGTIRQFWLVDNDAGWRPTRRTHESYVAELIAKGKMLPILFAILGFRLELIMVDVLHCVDLGVACHILGNGFLNALNAKYLCRQRRKKLISNIWSGAWTNFIRKRKRKASYKASSL